MTSRMRDVSFIQFHANVCGLQFIIILHILRFIYLAFDLGQQFLSRIYSYIKRVYYSHYETRSNYTPVNYIKWNLPSNIRPEAFVPTRRHGALKFMSRFLERILLRWQWSVSPLETLQMLSMMQQNCREKIHSHQANNE